MLFRKIENQIEAHLRSSGDKILIVDGARQIGKSYIIRHVGQRLYRNFIELNMEADKVGARLFAEAKTTSDFYMALSTIAGDKMGDKASTLVFIDEIQAYDHLLTLLKFLRDEDRFNYIASGSQLGITLKQTSSIPLGSIRILHMYPMDFEEFLIANGVGSMFIDEMRTRFMRQEALPEALHNRIFDLFRKYLIVGGMPDAVNTFVSTQNIMEIRSIQQNIHHLYGVDASRYESANKRLRIQRIYEMIPSIMENRKKRIVAQQIESKTGKRMADYANEFDYLISSGITLEVKAISKPSFPLIENSGKNLLKLYLNDVGLLTGILYRNNIMPIMSDERSTDLGSVYETVVAQELRAHGFNLFYYDNKKNGEVDYLIDDYDNMSVAPIEVKSGKDYNIHSALNHFLQVEEYNIRKAYVFSNNRETSTTNGITYLPIYYIMFLQQ